MRDNNITLKSSRIRRTSYVAHIGERNAYAILIGTPEGTVWGT
jgi:hypothetical protein